MRNLVVCALVLVGCTDGGRRDPNAVGGGGGGGEEGGGGEGMDAGTTGPDLMPVPYPAGPYGHQIGDVMADFTVQGYRLTPQQTDSKQLTWDTAIKLSEYHAPGACKCLLITIGALWCSACQDEQPALVSDVGGDPSFCVLGVLQEGGQQQVMATKKDVDTWTQYFNQNFSVVQGTGTTDHLLSGFGSSIGLPFSFVVNPSTMKVLDVVQGFDPQIHDNAMALCNN